MFCSQCGQRAKEDAKFCAKCGSELHFVPNKNRTAYKDDKNQVFSKKLGLKGFISGDLGLSTTFWKYGVLPAVIGSLIVTILSSNSRPGMEELWQFVFICIGLVYMPFFLIALWKASDKYERNKWWVYLAKAFVVLEVFNSIELAIYAQELLK